MTESNHATVETLIDGLGIVISADAPADWHDLAEPAMAEYRERTGRDYTVTGVSAAFLHDRVVHTLRHEFTSYDYVLSEMSYRAFEQDADDEAQDVAKNEVRRQLHALIAAKYPDLKDATGRTAASGWSSGGHRRW